MNKWCVQVLPGILVGTLSGRASGGESVQPHTTGPAPGVPRASGGESTLPFSQIAHDPSMETAYLISLHEVGLVRFLQHQTA